MNMIFLICAYFEINWYAEASRRFLSFFMILKLSTRRGRPVGRKCLLLLGSWSHLYFFRGLCCSALNLGWLTRNCNFSWQYSNKVNPSNNISIIDGLDSRFEIHNRNFYSFPRVNDILNFNLPDMWTYNKQTDAGCLHPVKFDLNAFRKGTKELGIIVHTV